MQVVNMYHRVPYDVYVGRPKAGQPWGFGNPFVVGRDGERGACVPKFEQWLETGDPQGSPDATPERRQWILEHVHELEGKVLACFCAPAPCHAEVLVRWSQKGKTMNDQKIFRLAAIGSSGKWAQLAESEKELYRRLVGYTVQKYLGRGARVILHTGAAPGADQVAAEIALRLGAEVFLALPKGDHEAEWISQMRYQFGGKVQIRVYNPHQDAAWLTSVTKYHPYYQRKPELLTTDRRHQFIGCLHARNWGILMEHRVDAVIALPNSAPDGGGTGQGIRIAAGERIWCYNLAYDTAPATRPNEKGRDVACALLGDYQLVLPEWPKAARTRQAPPAAPPRPTVRPDGLYPVALWADGGANPNPGPAGGGVVAVYQRPDGQPMVKEWSLAFGVCTNQAAELQAAIAALGKIKDLSRCAVTLTLDSKYVLGFLEPGSTWQAKANVELVTELRRLAKRCGSLKVQHVYGHTGQEHNERCDQLAQAGVKASANTLAGGQTTLESLLDS